jgi:hypothetical protein
VRKQEVPPEVIEKKASSALRLQQELKKNIGIVPVFDPFKGKMVVKC